MLISSKSVFAISTSEIVKLPPRSTLIACPPWPQVSQDLNISDVVPVAPNLFNIIRREVFSHVWTFTMMNIAATDCEQALAKAKSILANSPPSFPERRYHPGHDDAYWFVQCKISEDSIFILH